MPTLQHRVRRLERYFTRLPARGRVNDDRTAVLPTSLSAWVKRYLPHYFTRPFSRFHIWLAGELNTLHTRRGSRQALVAPRGSAKSTWVSLAYPLWTALEGRESYIWLISDSQAQRACCWRLSVGRSRRTAY